MQALIPCMAQVTVSGSLVRDYIMTRLWVFFSSAHEGCEGSNSRSRIKRLGLGHSSGLGQSGWRPHQGGGVCLLRQQEEG